ncbi:MAG: hypothetical protein MUO42_02990 [Anaerolineaceae bacterium]|jgi:lysozyme|nr:hypothetical protein [Anaerolineaceae bacterium]
MISGIDISEKNGSIDWSLVGNGDVTFAYIKATEALEIMDSQFTSNLMAARNSGILVGAYHWLNPELHVGQQLELFINTVKDFHGMLPPVVGLETLPTSIEEMEKNIKAFLILLEKKVGEKPVIYTSDTFWMTYLAQADWGCDYPLWIDKPGNLWPAQLWPWAGWTFWQSSYKTLLPGIPVNMGVNWFNGSLGDLKGMLIQ